MKKMKKFPAVVLVTGHIHEKNLEPLKEMLRDLPAGEVIEGLKKLTRKEQSIVFRLLPRDLAIEVFELMNHAWQHDLIVSFTTTETLDILESLEPDDRVHLLDEFPPEIAKRLLEQLPFDKRQITAQLMGYEDDTVGRIMSPLYIDVNRQMTVTQAIDHIRSERDRLSSPVNTIYVTDEQGKLHGALAVSELITASADETIENLVKDADINAVYTNDHQEDAARMLQELDAVELAVLDKQGKLVGVLTADDAMDVIREEITDDMFDKVGLLDITKRESDRSHRLIRGSFGHVFAVRVPFLLLTLAGGMLAGAVIGSFEELLETVVATAIFIPVIMDMGGNVGTQSSTIFTRALVLGQINMSRFVQHWAREVLYGFGMGIALGTLGGIIAGIWQGVWQLGLAVGISLTLTITLAIAFGFLVPFILVKLGFDQAAGADPIITTVKDITGLLIYFASVSFFMPQIV